MLDIGCGGGILSEAMARLGARVVGIDVVERNIAIARLHAETSGVAVEYRHVAAETLAGQGERYDVVLNMEVVEHVADLPGFLQAGGQLVRPGGLMVIATLNRTALSWLFAIIGAEYILRWLPRGTHRWRRFPKPRELERLLARDGLRVTARTGVRVNPFTRCFRLTRLMAVNYMLVAEKPRRVCSACGYIHFVEPKIGVGVMVVERGRLLLVRRTMQPERGKWGLPAGYLDAGEEPHRADADAATRRLFRRDSATLEAMPSPSGILDSPVRFRGDIASWIS